MTTSPQFPPIPAAYQSPPHTPTLRDQLSTPRSQIVLGTCVCAAGGIAFFNLDPSQYAIYPQCYLYKTTGILCAGCGATRAVYALIHLRILEAMHDNVLLVCGLPLVAWSFSKAIARAWLTNSWSSQPIFRSREEIRSTSIGTGMIFALCLIYMVLRNIPLEAFEPLRPLGPLQPASYAAFLRFLTLI